VVSLVTTRTTRVLHYVVAATAIELCVVGLVLGTGILHTDLPRFAVAPVRPLVLAVAVAISAAAQLARLTVRVGTATVSVTWGGAAAVVLCHEVPPAWVPAAFGVGVALARLVQAKLGDRMNGRALIYDTASLTLAGAAAGAAANVLTPVYAARLDPLVAAGLCLGALAYAAVAVFLAAFGVVTVHGGRIWRVFADTFRGALLVLVGNAIFGLLVVGVHGEPWLVLLPPGLWLAHQVYSYRLRGADERRIWQTFADATRELNRLDPQGAAVAGLRGALRLFPAASGVLLVETADGSQRGYRADAPGGVGASGRAGADGRVSPCEPTDLDGDPQVTARSLMVGRVRVGELRLRLRPEFRMRNRDLLMFAAYGDAVAAALHDATTHDALRAMAERAAHDAAHDPVTGLANRAGFLARGEMVVRELPADVPVALLLLDIDRFREVNDTLGHGAGDELLQIAGRRLFEALQPGELLARLGGDEFAVLFAALGQDAATGSVPLPEQQSAPGTGEYPRELAHAVGRARRLTESLALPTEVAGVQLSMEASVGVVVSAAGVLDLNELLRRADVAMYQAKRGGSRVAWYTTVADRASTDRLALLAELREALAHGDQLTLLIQPVVPLAGGPALGAEALVRWRHPRRGLLEPAEFVKVVEESELVGPFARFVLDRALEIAAGWAEVGLDLPIAVNLSPRNLHDRRLPRDVAMLLGRRGVRPERLILEINETVVTSELPVVDEVLGQLRQLGVQLAVDDFGSGYSSLTFLTRVPVDEVKVDGTFVHRMVESPEAAAIVRTTVELGKRLGVRVVAECVETAEQRAALVALGCTAGQGYLFCKPLPPEHALGVLHGLNRAPVRQLRAEGAS